MFDDDNDFFGSPDLDFDGDHDMVDDLLMLDIIEEEERELEKGSTPNNKEDYDWQEDYESGAEYEISPDDYDTREEFEEAIDEARDSFNDEDDSDCLDEADVDSHGINIPITISFSFGAVDDGKEKEENLTSIEKRKKDAREKLKLQENGWKLEADELERCKFILESDSIAANYLDVDGWFYYAEAIKNYFELPFTDVENDRQFFSLLSDLALVDSDLSLKIWHWCLNVFHQYLKYANFEDDITDSFFLNHGDIPDDYYDHIIEYMNEHEDFTDKLLDCTIEFTWGIPDLVITALEHDFIDLAYTIMQCGFANHHADVHDKIDSLKSCIDLCSYNDNHKLMRIFRDRIYPIVLTEEDTRIRCRMPKWEQEMEDYIEEYDNLEAEAWKEKYRNNNPHNIPIDFCKDEQDFLHREHRVKYGWREYYRNNRFNINPDDYETQDEYKEVYNRADHEERVARQLERRPDLLDTTVYSFCKVAIDYPNKQYYYYLIGELKLSVGDKVIVPFGQSNCEKEGVVVAIGECYGSALPCAVKFVKNVLRKI